MKVLIVDDSEMQQKLASIYLKNSDCGVITASNGLEGLAMASEQLPDLIILDIEMPEMDGIETLKKLKGSPNTASIPVLMCSSVKKEEVIQSALLLGAAGYINKPHGFKNFNATVKELVGK